MKDRIRVGYVWTNYNISSYRRDAIASLRAGNRGSYDPRFVVRHVGHATMHRVPNRRHWGFSRDAYRTYKRYLGLSREEQCTLIAPRSPDIF